jgi:hypothetical protein
MSTLVSNNFETVASLASYGYTDIQDCSVQAGAGLGGSSFGVRGTGTATQKYYCEYTVPVSPTGLFFDFQADFDHADDSHSTAGFSAFELQPVVGTNFFALYHGWTGRAIYVDAVGFYGESAAGVIPAAGTKCTIRCCGRFGTRSSPTAIDSDGYLRVMVDGVVVLSGDNLALKGGQGAGATVFWEQLQVGPMGRNDNLIIGDTGCGGVSPEIPANNSAECCASPGVEGSGVAGPGAGVERPVLLSAAWGGRCTGGGSVALLADLTDDEDWSDS